MEKLLNERVVEYHQAVANKITEISNREQTTKLYVLQTNYVAIIKIIEKKI